MIRRAVPEDMKAMLVMGAAFHAEAGYSESIPFDPETFAHTVAALGQHGLVLVDEKDGETVGMAAADVAPSICNRNVLLGREVFWYYRPEHRTGSGRHLLTALEEAARAYGATFFDVVAEDGKRSEALSRLYRRAEFSPSERVYRKRLNGCRSDQSLVA